MSSKMDDYKAKGTKTIEKIMDTEDNSKDFTAKEKTSGRTMAILAYIIPLIPYFLEKDNKYVKYHAKRGMDLFVIAILYSILYRILSSLIQVRINCGSFFGYNLGNYCKGTPWWVNWPLNIIGFAISIIAIIGIINVTKGKAKELPIINNIKIFNK